jgi:hypothetical protein
MGPEQECVVEMRIDSSKSIQWTGLPYIDFGDKLISHMVLHITRYHGVLIMTMFDLIRNERLEHE